MRKSVVIVIALLTAVVTIFSYCEATEKEPANTSSIYLTLVNKTHRLPNNWENKIQLDAAINALNEVYLIEHNAYIKYLELRSALLDKDVQIELDSVYRSVAEQQAIWDAWSSDPELGEEYCQKYLAVPGFSEHHTGLAIDIFIIKGDTEIRENDDMIADTADFAIIHELLPQYGFILRYPEGKEDITGYSYEPWHLRYVDDVDIATTITEQNLTLEEYLNAN